MLFLKSWEGSFWWIFFFAIGSFQEKKTSQFIFAIGFHQKTFTEFNFAIGSYNNIRELCSLTFLIHNRKNSRNLILQYWCKIMKINSAITSSARISTVKVSSINPLMQNVPKWLDRLLKCGWLFWDIMY